MTDRHAERDRSPTPQWSFTGPTDPFFDLSGEDPATFSFRQVGDKHFTLNEGFVYRDGSSPIVVGAETELKTDLASIPLFMTWFVPVNGRHTPAAVVHDSLVAEATRARKRGALSGREFARERSDADRVFLQAMRACGVAPLRRRLMHAAVTMATRWTGTMPHRFAVALWCVASLVGSAVLVWGLASGAWFIVVAALVAPVVAAPLWGWSNRAAAVIAGYAAWFITVPALVTALAYGAYCAAERALSLLRR